MKNLFCTHNQSLALKELGFDMPCFAYVYTGDTGNNVDRYEETEPSRDINFNHDSICIPQPLKSQVFEWFREKYSIVGYVVPHNGKWSYKIISNKINIELNGFKTYVDAELSCIDKLIELVENNLDK